MQAFGRAFIRYHRGLGRMPRAWKPWLLALLTSNMIVPLFYLSRWEAKVILGVALLGGAMLVTLTALSGFSRLLGLGHVFWAPLIAYLATRLDAHPAEDFYGCWLRVVIVLNSGSLVLDAANVVRYLRGERAEMVNGLEPAWEAASTEPRG